jgi:deazaflavin-dependent oxidoreductase (nitroreductase family)
MTAKLAAFLDRVAGTLLALGRHLLDLQERTGTKAFLVSGMSKLHLWIYRRTDGRFGGNPGAPTLLLTATGRSTGRRKTLPLYYLPDGDRQVLCASYGGDDKNPQWFLNLMANPMATVQIGSKERTVRARVAEGEERAQLWPRVVEMWPSYAHYQRRTSRELPLVVLERP